MTARITARQINDRTKNQFGRTRKDRAVDVINNGNPDTMVSGIGMNYTSSIEGRKRSTAIWLNPFISEVPNEWIPANESCWIPWHM